MKIYLTLLILFLGLYCEAQQAKKLDIKFVIIDSMSDISVDELKFYLSNFSLLSNGKEVWKEKNSFHLLNRDIKSSLSFSFALKKNAQFDQLKFRLGIDSTTNAAGAKGGDLDPTKGMYWAWQSGYINLKCEGKDIDGASFQYHLGGFQSGFDACQQIILEVPTTDKIRINLNIKNWLQSINRNETNHIMSPSKEAVTLSKKLATYFSIE